MRIPNQKLIIEFTEFIKSEINNFNSLSDEKLAILSHFKQLGINSEKNPFYKESNSIVKEWISINYGKDNSTQDRVKHILNFFLKSKDLFKPKFHAIQEPKFTFIDLFAGIGGFRLAAQNLGGQCVYTSEWDTHAKRTYLNNFGEIPFGDITLAENKQRVPKKFDFLFAGFPCQPFSYAGLNKGFEDKTRGTLFFDVLDILKTHKPNYFILENVKGLKSHDGGKTMNTILESLKDLGYHTEWKILNSYDFGLPQYRERWYCVGSKKKISFEFPSGNKRGTKLSSIVMEEFNNERKLKLSDFEIQRINYHFRSNEVRVKHDNSKYELHTKKGRHGVYSYQKSDGSLRFHIGDRAKTQIQEAFYACLDTYAPTIIANRVPKLWDIERRLSVKEALRLQGFPDDFDPTVSDNQAYRQVGNSVAIPVVQAVLNQILITI